MRPAGEGQLLMERGSDHVSALGHAGARQRRHGCGDWGPQQPHWSGQSWGRGLEPRSTPAVCPTPQAGPARVSARCFFSWCEEIVPPLPHRKCWSPSSLHVSATCRSMLGRSPFVLEGTRISSSVSRKRVWAFGPLDHIANACDARVGLPRSYRFPVFLPHIKYLCFLIYFPPAH